MKIEIPFVCIEKEQEISYIPCEQYMDDFDPSLEEEYQRENQWIDEDQKMRMALQEAEDLSYYPDLQEQQHESLDQYRTFKTYSGDEMNYLTPDEQEDQLEVYYNQRSIQEQIDESEYYAQVARQQELDGFVVPQQPTMWDEEEDEVFQMGDDIVFNQQQEQEDQEMPPLVDEYLEVNIPEHELLVIKISHRRSPTEQVSRYVPHNHGSMQCPRCHEFQADSALRSYFTRRECGVCSYKYSHENLDQLLRLVLAKINLLDRLSWESISQHIGPPFFLMDYGRRILNYSFSVAKSTKDAQSTTLNLSDIYQYHVPGVDHDDQVETFPFTFSSYRVRKAIVSQVVINCTEGKVIFENFMERGEGQKFEFDAEYGKPTYFCIPDYSVDVIKEIETNIDYAPWTTLAEEGDPPDIPSISVLYQYDYHAEQSGMVIVQTNVVMEIELISLSAESCG